MSKQTSIEWLFERFENGDMYNLEDAQFIKHQALKMHKEEIKSPQTEISDEEITKLANEHILYNNSKRQWIIEGMKLYKEQLKRGNNES